MGSVASLLDKFNLSSYAAAFEREGFDDAAFLVLLAQVDRERLARHLKDDLSMKPGHVAKFCDYAALEPRTAKKRARDESALTERSVTAASEDTTGSGYRPAYISVKACEASAAVIADAESLAVWRAAHEVKRRGEAVTVCVHGWAIEYRLRGEDTNGTRVGDLYLLTPESWALACAGKRTKRGSQQDIRSFGSLHRVLEQRLRARSGHVWLPPAKGETIEVEVADRADGECVWREGTVQRVLPDLRFQVFVCEADGSYDEADPFLEWFSEENEGKDWRRRAQRLALPAPRPVGST